MWKFYPIVRVVADAEIDIFVLSLSRFLDCCTRCVVWDERGYVHEPQWEINLIDEQEEKSEVRGGVEVGIWWWCHHSLITRFAILTAHLSAVIQLIAGLFCRWSSIDGFGEKLGKWEKKEEEIFNYLRWRILVWREISKAFLLRIEGGGIDFRTKRKM